MSALADRIRQRAGAYEEAHRRRPQRRPPPDPGEVLAVFPAKDNGEIRVAWFQEHGRPPCLQVRLWMDDVGDGVLYPVRAVGISIPVYNVARFAEGVARGLELAIQHEEARLRNAGLPRTPEETRAGDL